jgi:hypothetical protein
MPPPFRSKPSKGRVVTRYDARVARQQDADSALLSLSPTALFWLRVAAKSGQPCKIDGYVARHMVGNLLLRRIPDGKKSLYQITFLGESVVELADERSIVVKNKVEL